MASTAPTSDSGYTGYSASYYGNAGKFNPTTAVVIIALIAGCFVLAFLSVVVRRCMRGEAALLQPSVGPQSDGNYNLKTRGLEKAAVDALPLVHRADLGEKDDHECPVCLTDFEPEENLRLLPSCKHVFHQDCIDMWFDSHSTCPLCRASLVGGDAGTNPTPGADHVAPRAPVESIYEVSENGDSDVEVHGGMRRDVPLEDSRTARGAAPPQPSAMITREGERSSARGTLFRNSESFKRAARGVEAYESAAAEAASEKDSSFRKPPAGSASVRRSSTTLGADLISLRNLLMGADQTANSSSGSSRWFTRARSFELVSRDRAVQSEYSAREPSRDEWVTIDLETGKAMSGAEPSTSSGGDSSKGPAAPERSWSDRFSLSSLKSLKGIAILSRSTSDVSSRHALHLPT